MSIPLKIFNPSASTTYLRLLTTSLWDCLYAMSSSERMTWVKYAFQKLCTATFFMQQFFPFSLFETCSEFSAEEKLLIKKVWIQKLDFFCLRPRNFYSNNFLNEWELIFFMSLFCKGVSKTFWQSHFLSIHNHYFSFICGTQFRQTTRDKKRNENNKNATYFLFLEINPNFWTFYYKLK